MKYAFHPRATVFTISLLQLLLLLLLLFSNDTPNCGYLLPWWDFSSTHTLRTVILLLLLLTEMCRLSSRGKVAPTPTLLIIMALLWYYHVTGGIQAERIQLFWINRNNPVDIERHNSRRCVVAVWQKGAALCKLHCQRLISSSILLLQYQSVHQTVIQRRTSQSDYKLPRW